MSVFVNGRYILSLSTACMRSDCRGDLQEFGSPETCVVEVVTSNVRLYNRKRKRDRGCEMLSTLLDDAGTTEAM